MNPGWDHSQTALAVRELPCRERFRTLSNTRGTIAAAAHTGRPLLDQGRQGRPGPRPLCLPGPVLGVAGFPNRCWLRSVLDWTRHSARCPQRFLVSCKRPGPRWPLGAPPMRQPALRADRSPVSRYPVRQHARHVRQRAWSRGAKGERNSHAKLTCDQVVAMRTRFAAGERGYMLGAEYGVTPKVVSRIVTGRAWQHVGGPIQPWDSPRRRAARERFRKEAA